MARRALPGGAPALALAALCLALRGALVGGDYVQPAANPGTTPRQIQVDLDTGMPLVPPAFPSSFVAEVAWTVTRAEGDTDAVASEHDGDRTLATVYHERRVQAERIDVHSRDGTRVATTFLILHGKGVAYRVDRPGDDDDATCVHAQTPGPAVQTRLSHVASSFRGKERVHDGRVAERWDGAVPGYGTRETVVATRSVDGKRHAPIRSIFHRTDGGAVITVVTKYLAWNGTVERGVGVNALYNGQNLKLDPALFRPPPSDLCAPDATGVLSKSLEHRNTLHFNPLHHPRVTSGGGGGRGRRGRAESNERTSSAAKRETSAKRDAPSAAPPPGGFRRGDGVARRRVAANKDGSKPAAPWESHGVDPEVAAKGGDAHVHTRPAGTLLDSPLDGGGASWSIEREGSSYEYSSREGRSGLNGRSTRPYNRDRGWVDAGIVDGIPASKDDGSGPAHEYALLGSGSDEL